MYSVQAHSEEPCKSLKVGNFNQLKIKDEGSFDEAFKNTMFLAEFDASITSEKLIPLLNSSKSYLLLAKEKCTDSNFLFFDVVIKNTQQKYFSGVFVIKAGTYYSGPYVLNGVDEQVIFIQADKVK